MKYILIFVSWFNRKAKNLAIRLVKWTGKHREYIHPKHLLIDESHYWYMPQLSSDDLVADLGCGSGSHTIQAASRASKVIGFDGNANNLSIAKRLVSEKNLTRVEFQFCNLEEPLPCVDSLFSAVLALDILEHLHRRDEFLDEIFRILIPGGKLILSVPNSETSWKKELRKYDLFYYSDLDHKHEYQQDEIKEVLERHGFRVFMCDPTVYDTPWVGLIDVVGGISLRLYEKFAQWKRNQALKQPEEATGFRIVAVKTT
ncbi:MAG: hypothetical protein COV74_09225 [Candidatus Omnitrophica bacterium CG11_big_fil_rev_8_21_14_0_20_45_26]|uniref:Methyltransferase domain-containing protein n=1 Tax=Candidatus Abzuiibacterium crystallinum TaxID=1974748 RepID=A0A2H0LLT5_9BACT|nr:MAG: hypothetical protein COV74_09225 [Candidatus Omnitrophica bacterium CG11_big_fil_rev_8_21_14_0_20_45_26]PIW63252.1 MAG: hypothetical protein COW12_11200 [Candidatus Omnitrophica bacterium CG12_big_fil_rev_8_21_14_0_65_45_16]